ncbi:MAG TPA: hypothetical protein VK364_10255, partial [Hymenobacter sp.]|nr:hypothetical protein [Hymenobacter sp.]
MKKRFLSLFFAAALPLTTLAQAPQALNYQAVARNSSGAVLANQTISVKLSVHTNIATGTVVYSETHSGVTTNPFGLFTLEVGTGVASTGAFNTIDWANGAKFLKVEVDFGTGFLDMGTSQLLSVPYALFANSVQNDNDQQTLSVSGNSLSISGGNAVTLPVGSGDNWGTQTAATNATLTGNGTTGTPLGIAQQGATSGQVLKWNGTTWTPSNDIGGGTGDNWGTQAVVSNATLTGTGVTGSALGLAQQGATTGQVLKWNGTAWTPSNDTNTDAQTLSVSGNTLTISGGNNVTLPTGTTYTAGSGIAITGNTISATDNSATNELQTISKTGSTITLSNGGGTVTDSDGQTLSVSGSSLSISGGNSVTLPTGTAYSAGSGIAISGTTISATDNSSTNEIQTLAITGNQLTISGAGGNSVTLPSPSSFTLPYNNTVSSGATLFEITNSGSGGGGRFGNSSATSTSDALSGITYGLGYGVYGFNNNGVGRRTGVFGSYNGSSYGTGVMGIGWAGVDTLPNQADIGVYGSANTWG